MLGVNNKVSQKMVLVSAVSLLSAVGLTIFALITLNKVKVNGPIYYKIIQGKDLIADILPPPEYVIESYLTALQMKDEKDTKKQAELFEKIALLERDYEDRHQYWLKALESGKIKDLLVDTSYKPAKTFYDLMRSQYIPAIKTGDARASEQILTAMKNYYEEHREVIDEVVVLTNKANSTFENTAVRIIKESYAWLITLGIATAGLVILISMLSTISLVTMLRKITHSLNSAAEQTASASSQVAGASQELSRGSTEQASSIEEVSSSLEEMNAMISQNADNATHANQTSQEAQTTSENGNAAMQQMDLAMAAINQSSDKISKIIKTIEEIAFQTNLLALNAAVEAARAGEHEKGFAVVSEEVRNLAKRSAEAAKETASLIEDNIAKAKNGSEIAKKMAESLATITSHTKKVANFVAEIATASNEQASGIKQITGAITQLNQATQQTASTAEESASSAEELSSQAQLLKELVGDLTRLVGEATQRHIVQHMTGMTSSDVKAKHRFPATATAK